MSDLSSKKQELEELVLVVQKEQCHDSFGLIYDILIDAVYRYVFFRVDENEVDDVVENIFVKLWENISKYKARKDSSFVSWVFRVAHNMIVDHYRVREKYVYDKLSDFVADQKREHSPIVMTDDKLKAVKIREALLKLSEVYREVVTLKYFSGFSNLQIAEVMNKTEGSVRVLQFRALKELKKHLTAVGIEGL